MVLATLSPNNEGLIVRQINIFGYAAVAMGLATVFMILLIYVFWVLSLCDHFIHEDKASCRTRAFERNWEFLVAVVRGLKLYEEISFYCF